MGTLDELREALNARWNQAAEWPSEAAAAGQAAVCLCLSDLATYEREHPGLVDRTQPCDEWLCYNGLCVIREPNKPDVRVHGKASK